MKHKWMCLITAVMVMLFLSSTMAFSGQRTNSELIARQNTAGNSSPIAANSRQLGIAMDAPTGSDGAGPAIPHPSGSVVVVPVYNKFVSHNTTSVVVNNSVPFPVGSFSKITVTYFDTYVSNPFDTSFIVEVNGVQIMAGNTLELENTSVTQNVTDYYSILQGTASVLVTCPQFNPGYSSYLSVWFTFYAGTKAPQPSVVLPAFTSVGFPTPKNAFPVNVPIPFNVSRYANVTFPSNVTGAYINFYEQQNGNDEFWYTLQPPFREFRIFINGTLIDTIQPYPNIQTGGGDLFLWQPILGIGAELYPPHVIQLAPYLHLLHGTKTIQIQVLQDENLWIRVALNFMLTTGNAVVSSVGPSTSLQFHNHYVQSPQTNTTSESIPFSAAYLNDSEFVGEVFTSHGSQRSTLWSNASTFRKTVTFRGNSTIFDPSLNIVESTPYGDGLVYHQNFAVYEYINTTYSTYSTYLATTHGQKLQIVTTVQKSEYIQINGTDVFDIILSSPLSVLIGFNVTQVRDITTTTTVSLMSSAGSFTNSMTQVNDTIVNGTGAFLGTLNSKFELTSLLFNHAYTQKTVNSFAITDGQESASYYLKEIAVNDSLIARNGTLIYYQAS